jgi:hypothetical protein
MKYQTMGGYFLQPLSANSDDSTRKEHYKALFERLRLLLEGDQYHPVMAWAK